MHHCAGHAGVVGHQFGSGRGKDAATAAGAVGGGGDGRSPDEKNSNSGSYYRITVDLDSGATERKVDVADRPTSPAAAACACREEPRADPRGRSGLGANRC